MRIMKTTIALFLLLITTSVVTQEEIAIIPKPAQTEVKQGKFQFSSNTKFIVKGDAQKELAAAFRFQE